RQPEVSMPEPGNSAREKREEKTVRNGNIEPWIPVARHPLVLDHRIVQSTVHVAEQLRVWIGAVMRLLPPRRHVEEDIGRIEWGRNETYERNCDRQDDDDGLARTRYESQADEVNHRKAGYEAKDENLMDRGFLEALRGPNECRQYDV